MYDCDKGYVLEEGPPGATCVGGKWRPTELPKCLPGQHPRLRWNRRRRSIEMRYLRSKFLLENARRLKKWMMDNDDRFKFSDNKIEQIREKRNIHNIPFNPHKFLTRQVRIPHRFPFNPVVRFKRSKSYINRGLPYNGLSIDFRQNFLRQRRDPSEIERAYSKYYQKIKQKYQNYVKNLLGYNRLQNNPPAYITQTANNPAKKIQVQDGRWYNFHNNPESLAYRVTHKTRIASNDINDGELNDNGEIYDEENSHNHQTIGTVAIPDITQTTRYYSPRDDEDNSSPIYSNKVVYSVIPVNTQKNHHDGLRNFIRSHKIHQNSTEFSKNFTDLISQLKSQIVRRKRNASPQNPIDGNLEIKSEQNGGEQESISSILSPEDRKGRPKGPCEQLNEESFANITVVRQGKGPGRYSAGTILHLICNTGFKLNIKNPNATARCVRGIWKPQKPICLSGNNYME